MNRPMLAALILTTALIVPGTVEAAPVMTHVMPNVKAKVPQNVPNVQPNIVRPRINPVNAVQLMRNARDAKAGQHLPAVQDSLLPAVQDRTGPANAPHPRLARNGAEPASDPRGLLLPAIQLGGANADAIMDATAARGFSDVAGAGGLGFDLSAYAPEGFDDPLDDHRNTGTEQTDPREKVKSMMPDWMGGTSREPDALSLMPDMGHEGDSSPAAQFADSLVKSPDEMLASAKQGLASQDGGDTILTSEFMSGSDHVQRTSTYHADGTYYQVVLIDHADGTHTMRETMDNKDGVIWTFTTEMDESGNVTDEHTNADFVPHDEVDPHGEIAELRTGNEEGGGGILAPNCGSANCNGIRELLKDPGGALRAAVENGTNVMPPRDGYQQGSAPRARFVTEGDLLGQPDPNAMQGGGNGAGYARFYDGGKLINPGQPD